MAEKMAEKRNPPTIDRLRAQYEAYPYPPRDPNDEAERLITGSPSHIAEVNHYVFAGRRDFTQPFRALVAGGGTGDGAIMLGQQLKDTGGPGEVVYLDISKASAAIARARAERRGLDNISFIEGGIEDIETLDLGTFDYIDCCGVLHHLDDPAAGWRCLNATLGPDGGMGVMLYAKLGRVGVYDVQAMLRMIAGTDAGGGNDAQRLITARKLLDALPTTNWLKRNPLVGDHLSAGDAGLFDLLLHSRDRAYLVPEVAALADDAGMRITTFIEPARYDPSYYVSDSDITATLDPLSWMERCAFAELLAGNIKTHVFYAVKQANEADTVAKHDAGAAIPVPAGLDAAALGRGAARNQRLTIDYDGIKLTFDLPKLAAEILPRMDGERSLAEIHADMTPKPGWEDFMSDFGELFTALNGLNFLFLRIP
jgi:SAM-dependent methyltransferase